MEPIEEGLLNKHPEEFAADEEEQQEPGEDEIIVGEAGEGGQQIRLQKVMIQDLNQEFLMDEQGNLYDLNGQFVGKVGEEGDEEEEEGDPQNQAYDGGNNQVEELPEIQPVKNKRRQFK